MADTTKIDSKDTIKVMYSELETTRFLQTDKARRKECENHFVSTVCTAGYTWILNKLKGHPGEQDQDEKSVQETLKNTAVAFRCCLPPQSQSKKPQGHEMAECVRYLRTLYCHNILLKNSVIINTFVIDLRRQPWQILLKWMIWKQSYKS